MSRLDFPFTLCGERETGDSAVAEEVASREALLDALEGAAGVARHEADTLARKILDGQSVHVSAHGGGLRLYGKKA